jgi:hypothetical protein
VTDDHVLELPDQPSLEQLRKQAKDLRRAALANDPEAVAEIARRYQRPPRPSPADVPLRTAQLAVARRYGFASWTRLKKHVEIVTRYSRFPDRVTADADPAVEFLRLACLTYADDQPERWDEARRLLDLDRGIAAGNVYVAAATADAGQLRRVLAADPGAACREGGPYRWEPLFYLAYARHDPSVSLDAVLGSARLLLDAGADPNAGYLWHGLPTPFTVLTGAFGEGELGPVRQPRHPHSIALARLLLEAGADPNDGQALYNRMFEPGNDHLELLLEFGLGTGDGGPWRRRLGDALDAPAAMVRGELAWAITHGLADRVRLLVTHGVDLAAPFDDGVTVTSAAATAGHPELIGYLVEHGAPAPDLTPPDAFVAAALAADRARMGLLLADHPALAGQLREERPALITWAAACGSPAAVEFLVELGFDVNARGRTDVPSDLRDHRFNSTPLGWARYFGRPALIELLEPVTQPDTVVANTAE